MELAVWKESAADPARLRRTAEAIARAIARREASIEFDPEEEAAAREGRVLLRIHRARERYSEIVRRKKAQVLRQKGKLACEVCAFTFAVV